MNLNNLPRVDVMKVDVEGAEEMVIDGAASLLTDPKRRPRIILLELFNGNLKAFDTSVEAIMAKMSAMGYRASIIQHGGEVLMDHDANKHQRYYNIIFTV